MTYGNNIEAGDFHIPASDTKGHSERLYVRVSPKLADQLDSIFNTRMFPYKSKGHLLRHAIYRHINYLETLAPFPSNMKQIEAIDEILREEEFHSQFEEIYRRMESQISVYIRTGDIDHAKSLVERVRTRIKGMPEGDWKKKYMRSLKEQFSHLLSQEPASLTNFDEE